MKCNKSSAFPPKRDSYLSQAEDLERGTTAGLECVVITRLSLSLNEWLAALAERVFQDERKLQRLSR